jgi:hypothetical protein
VRVSRRVFFFLLSLLPRQLSVFFPVLGEKTLLEPIRFSLPASLPPRCAAAAAAAASTGAPPGELTNAQTAKEPATATRRAGLDVASVDADDGDDDEFVGNATAAAAAVAGVAFTALVVFGCGAPGSGTAARTTWMPRTTRRLGGGSERGGRRGTSARRAAVVDVDVAVIAAVARSLLAMNRCSAISSEVSRSNVSSENV